jgi:spore coat polysaccharide biosynthesis protein SpsF (cytidylyltransferase family)
MSARVVAIVQARLSSKRFPRKILAEIEGAPMLAHVIARAQQIEGVGQVVVATPVDELKEIQAALKVPCAWWGGPLNDVLARYFGAAVHFKAEVIVRVTGDDPLLDPALCSDLVRDFLAYGDMDYLHNLGENTDGWDCEVFSFNALHQAFLKAADRYEREHVTPWMQRNLRVTRAFVDGLAPKLSVDEPEDLERVRAIYRALAPKALFSRGEALQALASLAALPRAGDFGGQGAATVPPAPANRAQANVGLPGAG